MRYIVQYIAFDIGFFANKDKHDLLKVFTISLQIRCDQQGISRFMCYSESNLKTQIDLLNYRDETKHFKSGFQFNSITPVYFYVARVIKRVSKVKHIEQF